MYNLVSNFVKILDICKKFSNNLVDNRGNIPRRGVIPRFSDLEVIALSLTAENFSIDSESYLFHLLKKYKSEIPNLISRRQYNDRRKYTADLCEQIRKNIVQAIDGKEDIFSIDSKPIPVCRTVRAKRCKLGKTDYITAPDFGYCASQRCYYWGYKLHVLFGVNGIIHSYDMTKASVNDVKYLQDVKYEYFNCTIIGDKGYIGTDIQLDLFESSQIKLEVPYRLNQKDRQPIFAPFSKVRKRVEIAYSQMVDQFMISRNYAKQPKGVFTRIKNKIAIMTVLQYINFINNKPIGKIKHTLI